MIATLITFNVGGTLYQTTTHTIEMAGVNSLLRKILNHDSLRDDNMIFKIAPKYLFLRQRWADVPLYV